MAFEWTAITENDLGTIMLEVWIFELVKEYQEQIRELVLEFLGRNVMLEDIDLSGDTRTFPYAQFVNAVENNIKHLVGTDVTENMKPTVEWRGGLADIRRLDYTDVNRWFETIRLLYIFILSMRPQELQTDSWQTGGHLDLQFLGL